MAKKDALQDFFKIGLNDVSKYLKSIDTLNCSKDSEGKIIYNPVSGVLFSLLNDLTRMQSEASLDYINYMSDKTEENYNKAVSSIVDMTSLFHILKRE